MSKVAVNESSLQNIADAIRAKAKTTATYSPSQMGVAITNLPTRGFEEAPDNDVIFVDIHGRRLYSYTIEQAKALTTLPNLPEEDDGLEFRAWNWTLQDIKDTPYKKNIVIAPYPIIEDHTTKIWIKIVNKYINSVKLFIRSWNNAVVDWGDGDIEEPTQDTTTHIYDLGNYIITITPKDQTMATPYLTQYYEGNQEEEKWEASNYTKTIYRYVQGASISNVITLNNRTNIRYCYTPTTTITNLNYIGLDVYIEPQLTTASSLTFSELNNLKYISLLPNSKFTSLDIQYSLNVNKILIEDNVRKIALPLRSTVIKELDLSRINQVVDINTNTKFPQIIYVPAKLLNDYYNASIVDKFTFQPIGNALGAIANKKSVFNTTTHIEGSYISSEGINPNISLSSSIQGVIEFSNIVVDNVNKIFSFDVTSLSTESTPTITVSGDFNGDVVTTEFNIIIKETFPVPTYTVEDISGASYNFVLNTNNYYESTNQKVAGSAALCKITFNNVEGADIYFDCINYAEANYDYGIIGNPNIELSLNNTDDGVTGSTKVFKNFKGLSKSDIQTVVYTSDTNSLFMYVKFRKDGSGDNYNDSLQFKVRFE